MKSQIRKENRKADLSPIPEIERKNTKEVLNLDRVLLILLTEKTKNIEKNIRANITAKKTKKRAEEDPDLLHILLPDLDLIPEKKGDRNPDPSKVIERKKKYSYPEKPIRKENRDI